MTSQGFPESHRFRRPPATAIWQPTHRRCRVSASLQVHRQSGWPDDDNADADATVKSWNTSSVAQTTSRLPRGSHLPYHKNCRGKDVIKRPERFFLPTGGRPENYPGYANGRSPNEMLGSRGDT